MYSLADFSGFFALRYQTSFRMLSLKPNSNPGADQKSSSFILVLLTTQDSGTNLYCPLLHFCLHSTPLCGVDIASWGSACSVCGITKPGRLGVGFSALRDIALATVASDLVLILSRIGSFDIEFGLNEILEP